MHRPALLSAASIAMLLASTAPLARVPQDAPSPRDFRSWLDAVEAHAPGARDEQMYRVALWSRGDLNSVLGPLSTRADRLRIIPRAVVLHTDIAVLNRRPDGYDLPADTTTIMTLVEDGKAVGQTAGTYHWEFARRLIDRLPQGDVRVRVARPFYRAVAATLQSWGEHPEFTLHLSAARRVLGEDAVMLLFEGIQQQVFAGPRMQRFLDERRRAARAWRPAPQLPGRGPEPQPPPPPPLVPSVNGARERAELMFRRALALDPALREARIRLAHVLGDRGRHAEAAAELARLADVVLPPLLDYYAALVRGREARAADDLDAARTAFERAASLFPLAPVPKFALSEVAIARGDGRDARAYLAATAAADPGSADEPWWAIERIHEPSAEALIDEMRDVFTR